MTEQPDQPVTPSVSRRSRGIVAVSLILVLVTYVIIFYSWWVNSPMETKIVNGKPVRTILVRYNRFFWHTEPIWFPAFLFLEHVCGYERGGFAAMEHESVVVYSK